MKKIALFSLMCVSMFQVDAQQKNCPPKFMTAFTAGYVFKQHDAVFRDVYGYGMGNVITADGCYQPWRHFGVGAKLSYWLAAGRTTFLQQKIRLHEIPMTFYVRGIADFCRGLRLYVSAGGGAIWMKETSYLGHVSRFRGIGETEIGFNYSMNNRVNFTSAFRYLFPRQTQGINRVNVGGLDLRAGVGISF